MYEAILKKATNNTDFKFKVRNTPQPWSHVIQERKDGTNAGTITTVFGLCYALLLTTICANVVHERVHRLKHIQVISGV
jgi:hypothetical protein